MDMQKLVEKFMRDKSEANKLAIETHSRKHPMSVLILSETQLAILKSYGVTL